MTGAQELRTAAAKLRDGAENAPGGPWSATGTGDVITDFHPTHPDYAGSTDCRTLIQDAEVGVAAWCALADPGLSEPLAAWLEEAARQDDRNASRAPRHRFDLTHALAMARFINGSGS